MKPTVVVDATKEEYDMYIGRGGNGMDGYFANPFHTTLPGRRHEAEKAFLRYFHKKMAEDAEYRVRILGLRGLRLGSLPREFHGQIIATFLNRKVGNGGMKITAVV
jgi:hypothetical protein